MKDESAHRRAEVCLSEHRGNIVPNQTPTFARPFLLGEIKRINPSRPDNTINHKKDHK